MSEDEKLLTFGNWLLKKDWPDLHVETKGNNGIIYIRKPMKDILKMFKKETGL